MVRRCWVRSGLLFVPCSRKSFLFELLYSEASTGISMPEAANNFLHVVICGRIKGAYEFGRLGPNLRVCRKATGGVISGRTSE